MPVQETDNRKCPFCDEPIKAKAIICRHCRSTLAPQEAPDELISILPSAEGINISTSPQPTKTLNDVRSTATTSAPNVPKLKWKRGLALVLSVSFLAVFYNHSQRFAEAEKQYRTVSEYSKPSDLQLVNQTPDPNAGVFHNGQLPAPGQSGFLGSPKVSFTIRGNHCEQATEKDTDEVCADNLDVFRDYLIAKTAKFQPHIDEMLNNGKLCHVKSGTKISVLKAYRWTDYKIPDSRSLLACEQVQILSGEQNGKILYAQYPQKIDPLWLDSLSEDERKKATFAKAAWFLSKHSNESLNDCLNGFGLDYHDPFVYSIYSTWGDWDHILDTVPKSLIASSQDQNQPAAAAPFPVKNIADEFGDKNVAAHVDEPAALLSIPVGAKLGGNADENQSNNTGRLDAGSVPASQQMPDGIYVNGRAISLGMNKDIIEKKTETNALTEPGDTTWVLKDESNVSVKFSPTGKATEIALYVQPDKVSNSTFVVTQGTVVHLGKTRLSNIKQQCHGERFGELASGEGGCVQDVIFPSKDGSENVAFGISWNWPKNPNAESMDIKPEDKEKLIPISVQMKKELP